jgi:hypothetical protein
MKGALRGIVAGKIDALVRDAANRFPIFYGLIAEYSNVIGM